MRNKGEERVFVGIGVSPGIVMGKVLLLEAPGLSFTPRRISHVLIEAEIARFHKALERAKEELRQIKERLLSKGMVQQASLLDVHLQLLEDQMIVEGTEELVREELINAEWALEMMLKRVLEAFEKVNEDYIRERREDVRQVVQRVMRHLVGHPVPDLEAVTDGVVVVAHDLSPGDTAQLNIAKVMGFATDIGSSTSHTAIVAKSLGLPAVVGLKEITAHVRGGEAVIIDGNEGVVILEPSESTFKKYELKRQRHRYLMKELLKFAPLPSETLDGYHMALRANIEFVEEVSTLGQYGAEGVGLYRTEYLYLNRQDLPSEEEHFECYRKVVTGVAPHVATIRTLDLGGDKFASRIDVPGEMNPALGLRAIRLCLLERDIFKTQLCGILRASAYGKVRILLPMISSLEELREAKMAIEEAKEELDRRGVAFDPGVKIGVMIEVPSAAVVADILAKEVDFFSIGTNDLIQYTLAIDRINEHVAYLYQPLHPAILRLIEEVVERAHGEGIEVGVCGEMAADPLYTLVFLGLGLDELSMNAMAIPRVKRVLRKATKQEGKALLRELLRFSSAKEAEAFLRREMVSLFPDDFIRCEA